MPNQKEDIAECVERTEALLARFEEGKDKLADEYKAAKYEDAVHTAKTLIEIIEQILSIFQQAKHSHRKYGTDFRSDQRLVKLNISLKNTSSKIKEHLSQFNLGEFVRYVDKANVRVYNLLERCEAIAEAGINKTPEKNRIESTRVMREDFKNWEGWVREEKNNRQDHFGEGERSKNDHLLKILSMADKMEK